MVAAGITTGNIYLAIIAIFIGMLFLGFVRRRSKEVIVDERAEEVSGRAARLTHLIVTGFLGFLALLFLFAGYRSSEIYLISLGTVFCYIVCLSVAVYAMTFKYLDRKYSGKD